MKNIRFVQPDTVVHALEFLHEHPKARIVAGGTDLLPEYREKEDNAITGFIDIMRIRELSGISFDDHAAHIGALATHAMIAQNGTLKERLPVLSAACSHVGSPQIRNLGTIGGNIITMSACADTLPALLVLEARMVMRSLHKTRTITVEEYIDEKRKQLVPPGEMLIKIVCDLPDEVPLSYFFKLSRRAAAAKARMTVARTAYIESGQVRNLRLSVGAVTSLALRYREAEKLIEGKAVTDQLCCQAGERVVHDMLAVTGRRKSAAYKIPVLTEMVRRSLEGLQ